jgi:hypothetical protein
MSTPQNTAPDFGEPWQATDHHFVTTEGNFSTGVLASLRRKRIAACVNACAGLADPAAEIEAMRAAIKEASSHLSGFLGFHSDTLTTAQMRSISDCLAKLATFLP